MSNLKKGAGLVAGAAAVLVIGSTGGAVAGGMIGGGQIKHDSISTKHIRDGAVTSMDLRDGRVKGMDVKEGSLGWRHLNPTTKGVIENKAGKDGKDGKDGLTNYSIRAVDSWSKGYALDGTENTSTNIAPGEVRQLIAECTNGRQVISGGFTMATLGAARANKTVAGDIQLLTSEPYQIREDDMNPETGVWGSTRWRVVVKNNHATQAVKILPYVVCADVTFVGQTG